MAQELMKKWLDAECAQYARKVERLEKLRPALECAQALVDAFPDAALEIRKYLNGKSNVEVKITVSSIRDDVLPYLDWVQNWAGGNGESGFEFNETKDYVTPWTMQRDYHADLFTICADVPSTSENKGCRKVVVGYESVSPQPIYEIVCED